MDQELTENILKNIRWRNGILPSGELAEEPCFVQQEMPTIRLLAEDQSKSLVVTQSNWTSNLVDSGILWNLDDDTTMHALAECYLLFHCTPQQLFQKSLHLIHFETCAWFPVHHILRTTTKFQRALDTMLRYWPTQPTSAWHQLCHIWHTFGFLWPQKIILGQKQHIQKSYQYTNEAERLYRLRIAKDEVASQLVRKEESSAHPPGSWVIIKRNDVRPIHEFLPKSTREVIQAIMQHFVHRIPLHHPFKLRNVCTSAYLSWRPHVGKGHRDEQPLLFSTVIPTENMRDTQYLWRFSLTAPPLIHPSYSSSYQPQYVRCGNQLFLYPACETPLSTVSSTHKMILARSSVAPTEEPRVRQEHMMSSREHLSRLRSVELLDVDTEPSRDNTDHQWMIEMPGLGLGRDDDASTDDNLNADIAIGRKKAILHGDVIGLRQILYLCSMAHLKSAASPKSTLSIPSQPPPATVTTSNATNKSHEISAIPLPQPQPLAGQLQPVVVKEHALLRVPGENAWIIELATLKDIEIHPHYRPLSQESVSHIPKVAAVVQRRTQSTRLKSAMSAESIQTNHASSLRRVRSFTSFTRRQDQEEVAEGEEEQEAIHIAESSVLFNSYQAPSMVTEDEMASDRAKPYLALYASKKNSKTWSHLVKRATLANLTRLVQSGTRTSPTGPLL